jgi:hypothetical protein
MSETFRVFFRTSKKFGKNPPPEASDVITYKSLLRSFSPNEIVVICDNCTENQVAYFKTVNPFVYTTSFGNCGSFKYQLGLTDIFPADIFYFVESDHLHLPQQKEWISTGLKHFKLVSLYDHPDKYFWPVYNDLKRKIIVSNTGYWASTPSTVMTFATRKDTLKEIKNILVSDEYNDSNFTCPRDHDMFVHLNEKGYTLGTPLPGRSTHLDIGGHSPYINWANYIAELSRE